MVFLIVIHSKYFSVYDWLKTRGFVFITSKRSPNLEDVCDLWKPVFKEGIILNEY